MSAMFAIEHSDEVIELVMSAFGPKRTSLAALHMSAFDPKRTYAPRSMKSSRNLTGEFFGKLFAAPMPL
jgi:hypothetical protein